MAEETDRHGFRRFVLVSVVEIVHHPTKLLGLFAIPIVGGGMVVLMLQRYRHETHPRPNNHRPMRR